MRNSDRAVDVSRARGVVPSPETAFGDTALAATLTRQGAELTVGARRLVLASSEAADPTHPSYGVSPDGKQCLVLRPVGGEVKAIVIHNSTPCCKSVKAMRQSYTRRRANPFCASRGQKTSWNLRRRSGKPITCQRGWWRNAWTTSVAAAALSGLTRTLGAAIQVVWALNLDANHTFTSPSILWQQVSARRRVGIDCV